MENWWMYPFKPVLISENIMRKLDLSNYFIEEKFDGHRAIISVENKVKVYTRLRANLEVPKKLIETIEKMDLPKGSIFDGEIWSPDKRGGWKNLKECKITLWDIMHDGKRSTGKIPIESRIELLKNLIVQSDSVNIVKTEQASIARYEEIKEKSKSIKNWRSGFIHGVVLKRRSSMRHDHPSANKENPDWLKILFKGMKGWEPKDQK